MLNFGIHRFDYIDKLTSETYPMYPNIFDYIAKLTTVTVSDEARYISIYSQTYFWNVSNEARYIFLVSTVRKPEPASINVDRTCKC